MKSVNKVILAVALALACAVSAPSRSDAAPIVSISPSTQNTPEGPVSVDIIVSGLLAEILSGFSVTLDFNPAVLTFDSYTIGASLVPNASDDFSDTSNAATGFLDFFYSSSATVAALDAAQTSASFILATLNFTGVTGFSNLNLGLAGGAATPLTEVTANNPSGSDLGAALQDGSVCVGTAPCTSVPEPASLALLGSGILALVARRRTAKARS